MSVVTDRLQALLFAKPLQSSSPSRSLQPQQHGPQHFFLPAFTYPEIFLPICPSLWNYLPDSTVQCPTLTASSQPLASCFASLFGLFFCFVFAVFGCVLFRLVFFFSFFLFLRPPFNLAALSAQLGFAWHLAELL